jgi:hypothetical protein
MKRWVSVVWVALMVLGAVVTYAMKDSAGRAADHVHQLRADIAGEKEAINLLRAEWSVLDQPARLQSLIERYQEYLHLQPLDVRQLATLDDVPPKQAAPPLSAADAMQTGGIAKARKPAADHPGASKP